MEMQEYKLCKRGHVKSPDNVNSRGECKQCIRELTSAWRSRNPDKVSQYIQKDTERKKRNRKPRQVDIDGVKLCRNGHAKTKDNITHDGLCIQCLKERRRYNPIKKTIIDGVEYRLCKRGHARTPDNLNKIGQCKKCLKLRSSTPEQIQKKRLQARKPKNRARVKAYNALPERKAHRDKQNKKQAEQLADCFVAKCLKLTVKTAPPELIELKRKQLLFKRELNQLRQAIKGD